MEGGPSIQEVEEPLDSTSVEQQGTGCGARCCHLWCHPKGYMHRFVALFFMCFLGFGSYFCYDNPAALESNIKKDMDLSTTQYTMLYSFYSYPNVILCFIGGFLIDRVFGIRLGTIIYMGLTLIGQVIFALGGTFDAFWLMCFGRFIFGAGAESLAVAQNNYAVLWFKGRELNMVFGLQLSFARLGSSVNFWVIEDIYNAVQKNNSGYTGLGITLMIAGITCVLSMICALILGFLDRRAERVLHRSADADSEVASLKDIKDFKLTFWLVTVICFSYYVAIFPFITLGQGFFKDRFHMSSQEANTVDSIVYLISAGASPVLGLIVDKTGKNVFWIICSVFITIGAHCLLAFTDLNAYVGMSFMGIGYSVLASSLWPLVALIIPQYQLGTAYGVCQSIQNLGLALFPYLAGLIVDASGYVWMEVFFLSSLVVALAMGFILWMVDARGTGNLNMTPGQRRNYLASIQESEADRDKIISSQETLASLNVETINESGLQPSTDSEIRNRYLSRVGAPVSDAADEE